MKIVFDTSVWVDRLRQEDRHAILPRLEGNQTLWMSAVVAAELLAGCRNRRERRLIETLLAPFRRVHRLVAPRETDAMIAGKAMSRLRERAIALNNPGAALLDALIAATCVGIGALLVSHNAVDFERLASEMPLRFLAYDGWASARH